MNQIEKDIFQQVIELVAEQTGYSASKINPETRLYEDLRIDGDDASELMDAFINKFNVDMTGFNFDNHFGPEAAFNPLVYIYWLIFNRKALHKDPIRIIDLVHSAQVKKWIVPGRGSSFVSRDS